MRKIEVFFIYKHVSLTNIFIYLIVARLLMIPQADIPVNLVTPYISIRYKISCATIIMFWMVVPVIIADLHIDLSQDSSMNLILFIIFTVNIIALAILVLLTAKWLTQSHIRYGQFDIVLLFFIYTSLLATVVYIYYLAHFYIAVIVLCLYCLYIITHTCSMGFVIYDLHLRKCHHRQLRIVTTRAVSETSISMNTESSFSE